MPLPQIQEIMDEHLKDPSKRHAQHALARDVVEMVHGAKEANDAEASHRMLFGDRSRQERPALVSGDLNNSLNEKAPQTNSSNMPSVNIVLPHSLVYNQSMARILYAAGLVSSKSEGHRLASNQGAYVGSRADGTGRMRDDLSFTPVKLFKPYQTKDYIIDGDLLILRVGKWKLKVIKIISDEEFTRRGLNAPGWEDLENEVEEEVEKKVVKKVVKKVKKKVEKDVEKDVKKEVWKEVEKEDGYEEDEMRKPQPKMGRFKEFRMKGGHVRW